MTSRRVVFTGKQEATCEAFDPKPPGSGEVMVESHYTLMSTGTENTVFNQLFEPGSHWDQFVRYPYHPGYCAMGEIVEVGPNVIDRTVGQRVVLRSFHASHNCVVAESTYPVPDPVKGTDAVWFALAKIGFMGLRVSNYYVGGNVLIIGAGPIGQMSVRWAAAAGLEHIVIVDHAPDRLALAASGGATAVINQPVGQCRDAVLAALGGYLPEVVNDATGNAEVFSTALSLTADRGRVVILGDTGSPTQQHLTKDIVVRGLTVVGAHNDHMDARWNDATITSLFFSLLQRGRFDLSSLNTHTFEPSDAALAYEIANTRRHETMGIVFDWTAGSAAANRA